MNATNGLTKQNCRVACLQNRKNPIVYVFPGMIKEFVNSEEIDEIQRNHRDTYYSSVSVLGNTLPAKQHVPYKQDDFIGFPRISDIIFPSPPKYS